MDMNCFGQIVLLCLMLASVSLADRIPGICSVQADDTSHAGLRPKVAQIFTVDVECNFLDKNKTVYVKQHYDFKAKQARLAIRDPTSSTDLEIFYDYINNQALVVDTVAGGQCVTSLLTGNKDNFIFGYRLVGGVQTEILSPLGALHFGRSNQTYKGTSLIRGIVVDSWSSCQYLDTLDATGNVTWYFTSKNAWDMQIGFQTVPIRLQVNGAFRKNGVVTAFNHIYDFFNFQPSVEQSAFQVPAGVYCPGRKYLQNTPFPSVPPAFSFYMEYADNFNAQYSFMEEMCDSKAKFIRYSYNNNPTSLLNGDNILELNDYNTGVSYVLNKDTGSCNIIPLKTNGTSGFMRNVNGQKVRMATPAEQFVDNNTNYQYGGVFTVRGISCERWVARTDQYIGFLGTNITLEWYFALGDEDTWNIDDSDKMGTQWRVPVQLNMFFPGDLKQPVCHFNIYGFEVKLPPVADLDLSMCFQSAARKSIRISFPARYLSTIRQNIALTKMAIKQSISDQCAISMLRITDIRFYFDTSIYVMFDLLDKPPDYQDVVQVETNKEVSLSEALKFLNDSFTQRTIQFYIGTNSDPITLIPNYDSFEDITDIVFSTSGGTTEHTHSGDIFSTMGMPQTTKPPAVSGILRGTSDHKYSGGALAGLGVAMLIIGGACGVAGEVVFSRI